MESSKVATACVDGVFEDNPVDVFSAVRDSLSSFVEVVSILFLEKFLKVIDSCRFEDFEPINELVVVLAVWNFFDQHRENRQIVLHFTVLRKVDELDLGIVLLSSDCVFCGSLDDDSLQGVILSFPGIEVSEPDFIAFSCHVQTEEGSIPLDIPSELRIAELENVLW